MAATDQHPQALLAFSYSSTEVELLVPNYRHSHRLNLAWLNAFSNLCDDLTARLDDCILTTVLLTGERRLVTQDGYPWRTTIKIYHQDSIVFIAFPEFTFVNRIRDLERSSAIYLNARHEPPPSVLDRIINTLIFVLAYQEPTHESS